MADLKFVPHASPAEAERQLLLATSRIVAALAPSRIEADHLAQCLALVDAPRMFVCRTHAKSFSSADPCPGCVGARTTAPTGFLLDPATGTFHVSIHGRGSCGFTAGQPVPSITVPSAKLCSACHAITPAAVWSTDFTEAAP